MFFIERSSENLGIDPFMTTTICYTPKWGTLGESWMDNELQPKCVYMFQHGATSGYHTVKYESLGRLVWALSMFDPLKNLS